MMGKIIDPTKDPREEIAVRKEGIKICCKCNMVLNVSTITNTFYFYPNEGYYCGFCNQKFKIKNNSAL